MRELGHFCPPPSPWYIFGFRHIRTILPPWIFLDFGILDHFCLLGYFSTWGYKDILNSKSDKKSWRRFWTISSYVSNCFNISQYIYHSHKKIETFWIILSAVLFWIFSHIYFEGKFLKKMLNYIKSSRINFGDKMSWYFQIVHCWCIKTITQ